MISNCYVVTIDLVHLLVNKIAVSMRNGLRTQVSGFKCSSKIGSCPFSISITLFLKNICTLSFMYIDYLKSDFPFLIHIYIIFLILYLKLKDKFESTNLEILSPYLITENCKKWAVKYYSNNKYSVSKKKLNILLDKSLKIY